MATNDSYQDYLIQRLRDKSYAALYLETHFELDEYETTDPQLLRLAFRNVAEALAQNTMTAAEIKLLFEKLDQLLEKKGADVIYDLGTWLNCLGLKLTVTVDRTSEKAVQSALSSPEKIAILT